MMLKRTVTAVFKLLVVGSLIIIAMALPGERPFGTVPLKAQGRSDLKAQHRQLSPLFGLRGVVFTDADETAGRLVVGVADPGARGLVRARLSALGVPSESVDIVDTDPIFPLTSLRDKVRPIEGGVQIRFSNYLCSLGFVALREGVLGFVTASHCSDSQGTADGTPYYQALNQVADEFIGRETADPPYVQEGCADGQNCRYSDANFNAGAAGVELALGSIAKTTGPNDGSLDINGTFTIVGEDTAVVGETVNKVGRSTGWTQGTVTRTCIDVSVSRGILLRCQDLVEYGTAIAASGDSGSPVFRTESGDQVTLLGALWGGNSSGTQFVYSPIAAIKQELGISHVMQPAPVPLAGGGTGLGLVESAGSPYTTAIGYSALASNAGSANTAAGYMALNHNTSGFENVGAGYGSLYWNTTGYDNTAYGTNSMIGNTTGYYNVGIGASALFGNSSGYSNTAVGTSSLSSAATGHDNAALGFFAGLSATGSYNTFIGSRSDANAGLTNATAIGYAAYVTQSNSLVLGIINGIQGATADTNVGIGTTAPVARLHVSGGETRLGNSNGSYSHFNYAGTSVNYIRGTTYFDTNPVYFTGGSVGIGTAAPAARLHVSGGETRLGNSNGSYSHFNYAGTSVNYIRGVTYFDSAPVYFTGGNIGIGTIAPAYPLHMGSGAHVTVGGVWTDASSRTLKQQIAPLPLADAETALAALQPVSYAYKADPTDRHVGFIAEDVPELVATPDRKSLAPMDLVAVLTKVVQNQQAIIGELEKRIAELERKMAAAKQQ
jgi:hypothetical protein